MIAVAASGLGGDQQRALTSNIARVSMTGGRRRYYCWLGHNGVSFTNSPPGAFDPPNRTSGVNRRWHAAVVDHSMPAAPALTP